jgi:hypothetical protein
MKKKDLRKIIKSIKRRIKKGVKEPRYDTPTPMRKRKRVSNDLICDYDSETSEKFYKFVLAIFKFRDVLSFEVDEEGVGIYGDLNKLTSKVVSNTGYQSEDMLEIKINKDGFSFRRNFGSNIRFSDKEMLNRLSCSLKEKNETYSKIKLAEYINEISISTNVVRELNLDNLINSFSETK